MQQYYFYFLLLLLAFVWTSIGGTHSNWNSSWINLSQCWQPSQSNTQQFRAVDIRTTLPNVNRFRHFSFNMWEISVFSVKKFQFEIGNFIMIVPIERAEISRQYLNNWFRLEMYYLGKTLADLPIEVKHLF